MAPARKRLDHLVVDHGWADSGARAQALIIAGEIRVEGQLADKPGKQYPIDSRIEYVPRVKRFASRGGEKLNSVLEVLRIDPEGAVVIDVGCSTGGFTDLLLQRGASKVYAVDVGKGILDMKLREDPRVIVMEGVNARHLTPEHITEEADLIVIDVSFISLVHIFPAILPLLKPEGILLPMIKPQFEAGRDQVPRGGVVKDSAVIADVLLRMATILYNEGMAVVDLAPSAVKGPKGNQEFFLLAHNRKSRPDDPRLESLVASALHV